MIRLDTIDTALAALRDRRPVIVVDDEDRENEGDLIMPATTMTPEWMGFIIRHTSGVVCAPMPAARARTLDLPPMTAVNEDAKGTAYTVTCDAASGVTTGISAADRTVTVHTLANESPDPASITRPGHVLPLIARDGGVRERPGHTEAGVELCRLADLGEVAVIAELVHDHGPMLRGDDLRVFADTHGLPLISIADLIAHLDAADAVATGLPQEPLGPAPEVVATPAVTLPTPHGDFRTRAWRQLDPQGRPGTEHLTLEAGLTGDPAAASSAVGTGQSASPEQTPLGTTAEQPAAVPADAPLVRVHSECLTGDAFGSHRCDCGEQLDESLDLVAQHGGVVVYVRGHEGRGIGLWEKIRAYGLQEQGADTVDANLQLGHPEDARDYRAAAAILTDMGLTRVRLLTNNPAKINALRAHGIDVVDRVPLEATARPQNAHYLATKRARMQHLLEASAPGTAAGAAAARTSTSAPSPAGPTTTDTSAHDRKAS